MAGVIVDTLLQGLLPGYDLVGIYARTPAKAKELAHRMQEKGRACAVCSTLDTLLALKPHFLVEAATPEAMKEVALPTLKNGTSIVTLSIGAFADTPFLEEVKKVATEYNTKVYIASGATGGFDVLRTATLMGNASARFLNQKGVKAFRDSPYYTAEMEERNRPVFSGTARQAIEAFPTGLNVAVAASLATVGPEELHVTMESTPDFEGDRQRVEIKNDQVYAVVDVYSATAEIAAWSVVHTLQNINAPIVF